MRAAGARNNGVVVLNGQSSARGQQAVVAVVNGRQRTAVTAQRELAATRVSGEWAGRCARNKRAVKRTGVDNEE